MFHLLPITPKHSSKYPQLWRYGQTIFFLYVISKIEAQQEKFIKNFSKILELTLLRKLPNFLCIGYAIKNWNCSSKYSWTFPNSPFFILSNSFINSSYPIIHSQLARKISLWENFQFVCMHVEHVTLFLQLCTFLWIKFIFYSIEIFKSHNNGGKKSFLRLFCRHVHRLLYLFFLLIILEWNRKFIEFDFVWKCDENWSKKSNEPK